MTWISGLNSFSRATKSLRDLGSLGYQGSASGSSDSLLVLSKVISPSASAVGQAHAHAVTGSKSRPGFDRFSLGEMKGRKRSPGDAVIISQLPESYGHMAPDFQLPAGSRGSFSRV